MTEEKPLFIPLKEEYYLEFLNGTKLFMEEFRKYGPRWNERTCRLGRAVVLSCGYGKKRRTRGKIVGFRTSWRITNQRDYISCYGPLNKENPQPAACIKLELEK